MSGHEPPRDGDEATRSGEPELNESGASSSPTRLGRLGDYELLREIGRGGMGVVYEARQISLNRRVALKVLPPGLGLTDQAVKRFEREAQAAAKLHHTSIVPVYAIGQSDGSHYYAMELIEGQPLSEVLRDLRGAGANPLLDQTVTKLGQEQRTASKPESDHGDSSITSLSDSQSGGRKWFDAVAKLIADVADALHYAHGRGVIHRDVKPANLMLSNEGRLCVTDFGLARVVQEPGMTVSGSLMGTPAYMSPEQITAGRVKLDHRTDVYSLGAVLYEILARRRPFPGDNREEVLSGILTKDPRPPRRFNPRVPIDLETIALKAMEKDPDRRYATAGELAFDLRLYLHGGLITARRASLPRRAWKSIRRHPLAATVTVAALVLALVIGFGWQALRQADVPRLLTEANLMLERGDHQTGLAAAERALELEPGLPEARILRARLLLQLVRHDEVIAEARAMLDENSDDWAAHFVLAFVAIDGDRPAIPAAEHLAAVERLAPESADVYLLRGMLAKSDNEAVELYTRALELNPAHTWALLRRADRQRDLKNFEAQRADAERMLAIRPRSPRGRRMLGAYYYTKVERDFERALAEYTKAIELDPEDPNSYMERGWVHVAMDRDEDAIADITRAIEIGPPRALFYRHRANAYRRLERDEEAIADARKGLELNPDDRWIFNGLLSSYQKLDRMEEFEQTAEEYRTRAAGWADPVARADAYGSLSMGYQRIGDLDRALEHADLGVEADPEHLWSRTQRINVLRALNDRAEFDAECEAISALDPVDPDPRRDQANCLGWSCRRWERMVELMDGVIEDYPDWAKVYVDRGTALYFLKRYEEALPDFDRAVELNPRFEQAYGNRAVIHQQLNRYEAMQADQDKVFELNPRNIVNLNNRAAQYQYLGRMEAALADLDRALEVNPLYAWAYWVRAEVKSELGRFEKAVADANRSIELDPTQPRSYFALINATRGLEDDGQTREAIEKLRAAADAWVDDETAALGFLNVSHNARLLGDYEAALRAADRTIELDPDNPWGLISRARLRLSQGDRAGFRADCDAAAGIERKSLNERTEDAQGLGEHCNDWERARLELARILEQDPDEDGAWFWRGRSDVRLGQADEALAAFSEFIRIDSRPSTGHLERAAVLAARADCDGAMEELRTARKRVPERLLTRASEAWIHTAILLHTCPDVYDSPAALELAQGVVAVNPHNWAHQLALGMALYRNGRFEEALAALEKAPTIDDLPANEPLWLFPQAMARWQLGRGEAARATYRRAEASMSECCPRFPVFLLLRDETARILGID